MTLTISDNEYELLCNTSSEPQEYNLNLEEFEVCWERPKNLGQRGYTNQIELMSGVELETFNWRCDRDLIVTAPVHEHPIQLLVYLSGISYYKEVYPNLDTTQGYLSGSGISPAYQIKYTCPQHFIGINVHIEPQALFSLLSIEDDSAFARLFLKQHNWKTAFFPEITSSVRSLVKQVISVPYRGMTKKLYLQAKVLELLAMQLDPIVTEFNNPVVESTFRSQTVDRIYQARDILATSLENPPSILELARQVGISDRTLRRGFRELFDTTIVGFLTSLRLEKARQLLREEKQTISEVANLVGYSNLSYFAASFKRQFGITPSECWAGKLCQRNENK